MDKVAKTSVFLPFPRPAYNALRAFCNVVNADMQIVFINAVRQHLNEHIENFNEDDRKKYEQQLDGLERGDPDEISHDAGG
jgi:hypothetical protein